MTTNSAIQKACNDILIAANLGYPISWPGINFTPPTSGYWLVVTHLPNRGVDDRLANDSHVSPQGIYQVTVNSRPTSEINLREVAEQVQQVFRKGTAVVFTDEIANDGATLELDFATEYYFYSPIYTESTRIRVTRHPYTTSAMYVDDHMELAVTVEYSE